MSGKTLYDKLWDSHIVSQDANGAALIYIDRHLLHEVTSPQAFDGLRLNQRQPWRLSANLAVPDHNVPTTLTERQGGSQAIVDPVSRLQVETLENNCQAFNVNLIGMNDIRQGIVHAIGPEQGATLPGMTIVCGDSHTSTHGAFAALAFGIGTSEVEHVLATQCLIQKKSKNMLIEVNGQLPVGISGKDIVLAIIGEIGTAGGTGYAIEFAGEAIRALSVEGRMTVCNMAIEAGARSGIIAADEKTIEYVRGRPFAPKGEQWEMAVAAWQDLKSDVDAQFDKVIKMDISQLKPQVTWGTSPEMVIAIDDNIPDPSKATDPVKAEGMTRALAYMGLNAGEKLTDIAVDKVFIGSCTNSRLEDLRIAASIVKGRKVAESVKQALVVAGSGLIKQKAEQEGLHQIFIDAGFEWREPGCSMCLGMNPDQLSEGERCASTSNRNFEGRQGKGGRTHLVSPAMAAAAAIAGHFVDVRHYL